MWPSCLSPHSQTLCHPTCPQEQEVPGHSRDPPHLPPGIVASIGPGPRRGHLCLTPSVTGIFLGCPEGAGSQLRSRQAISHPRCGTWDRTNRKEEPCLWKWLLFPRRGFNSLGPASGLSPFPWAGGPPSVHPGVSLPDTGQSPWCLWRGRCDDGGGRAEARKRPESGPVVWSGRKWPCPLWGCPSRWQRILGVTSPS